MKNSHIKTTAWAFLSLLSLTCYIYLHAASVEKFGACPSSLSESDKVEILENAGGTSVVLPDVELIKTLINITKVVAPEE